MNEVAVRDVEPDVATQSQMVEALCRSLGSATRVVETHISFVILTGSYAYKIKKAVDLGFLDFTTLASRAFYCREELRLNQRFAPEIYLDVVRICGSPRAPRLDGDGDAIDFAVRMREFASGALASDAIVTHTAGGAFIDELAQRIAQAHATARSDGKWGRPSSILDYAQRNFDRIRAAAGADAPIGEVDGVERWTAAEFARIAGVLRERRRAGRIRECHGDLHLRNIAVIDGHPVLFDCIEFSEPLRMIDVMSDLAFVAMDLIDHGRPDFAHRLVNEYLEVTGDYEGLRVLRFYMVYRAMVRAMVACERARQGHAADLDEARRYVDRARALSQPHRGAIVITHGYSGCGKTTASLAFVERAGAVRIRTDVERKRLHDLRPVDHDWQRVATAMYADDATRQVYARVLALTRTAIAAGFPVIVDGAFLKRWQRNAFREAAAGLRVPFVIVAFEARTGILRERIAKRMAHGRDASDADLSVLESQLRSADRFDADERVHTVFMDAETTLAGMRAPERWGGVMQRIA